jgi:hypothetical protein
MVNEEGGRRVEGRWGGKRKASEMFGKIPV